MNICNIYGHYVSKNKLKKTAVKTFLYGVYSVRITLYIYIYIYIYIYLYVYIYIIYIYICLF